MVVALAPGWAFIVWGDSVAAALAHAETRRRGAILSSPRAPRLRVSKGLVVTAEFFLLLPNVKDEPRP